MDWGKRGSLRCNVGGVPTPWGENSGQFPHCVAHGVPPALPRERLCDRETLFFEICYRGDQGQLSTWGYLFSFCADCVNPLVHPDTWWSRVGSLGASLPPSV
jgi:hypothetical protein